MFSLFNRNNEKVPSWASFFTKEEYNMFLKELTSYFKNKGLKPSLEDSSVKVDGGASGTQQFGLTNVAQLCKQNEPKMYHEVISLHFEAMERGEAFRLEFEKSADSYEKIESYIGVRLYPQHYMDNLSKDMFIGKDFADDMYAMLVFDMPDTITNIEPGQAKKWGKSLEELFEIGIRNTRTNNPLNMSVYDFGDFKVWLAQAEHYFVPNIMFELDNRPDLIGEYGALVGAPHRHAAFIYPIHGMEIIQAINGLIPTIYGMHAEGPGSLSPSLLWYHQGKFINLPYELSEENMRFMPPAAFVELLNDLAEKG